MIDPKFNPDKMVVGMRIYRNGTVEVVRRGTPTKAVPGIRSNTVKFTQRARDKMLFIATATEVKFRSMITLTYPDRFPVDGKQVKMHLKLFRQRFIRQHRSEMLWFLEFQRRGAPHFHVLCSVTSPGAPHRAGLGYMWADIICPRQNDSSPMASHERQFLEYQKVWRVHAHTSAWEDIREENGAVRYAAKYATKTAQKEVPKEYIDVGQFWGCTKLVRETARPIEEVDASYLEIRAILEGEGHRTAEFDWLPKFLWGVRSVEGVDKPDV